MIILRLKQQVTGTKNHFSLELLNNNKLLRTATLDNSIITSDINALCEQLQKELPDSIRYEVLNLLPKR